VSKTGSRHRHRPCSPAANHSPHSDHSRGHRYFAILGSPVYERAVSTTIVTEEPFFVTINLPSRRQSTDVFLRKCSEDNDARKNRWCYRFFDSVSEAFWLECGLDLVTLVLFSWATVEILCLFTAAGTP
jgi:hypothetical protein